jgi:outer membrane autotransporter protein
MTLNGAPDFTRNLILGCVFLAVSVGQAAAITSSPGCTAVNNGDWSQPSGHPPGPIATTPGFVDGDVINFTTAFVIGGSGFITVGWPGGSIPTAVGANPYNFSIGVTSVNAGTLFLGYNGSGSVRFSANCTPGPYTPPSPPSPSGKDASQAVTKGFLLSRINGMLLNSPGAMSLLNRNNSTVQQQMASAAGTANGAAAFGSVMGLGASLGSNLGDATGHGAAHLNDTEAASTGSNSIQFSQSLSGLRRQATAAQMERMSLGAGDGGALPLAYEISSPWDVWVEGRYSGFSDDAGNIDRDGHVGLLYVGGDYRVAENMIVGVLAQFDWSKDDSGVLNSKVDGNGWMIGPYMSAQIHENIYFDLRAAWGRSDNDLTIGTATGAFDTSRWLVKGTLAGNWVYDTWRITPTAELAYVTENQDAFTNSAGTFVPGQDVSLGRLQFGPEVGYRIQHTADTFIEPFAAIKGVWDWDNPNVAIIDGFVVGPGDFWGRLEGGLNVMTADGWLVRGMASWDGVGSNDYNGYTLQGIVNVPLN